ncbi:MAG: mechanosensitive ion channel domain-containing protein [Planctomycetota bacterium]|jgi:small conductance mechanosensitive channel
MAGEVRAALQAVMDADERVTSFLADLATDGQRVAEITLTLAKEPPPKPVPAIELPDKPVAFFEEEIQRHVAYLDYLVARGPRLEELETLVTSLDARLAEWTTIDETLTSRVDEGIAQLGKLADQVETGAIAAGDVSLPGEFDLATWQARLESTRAAATERSTRIDEARGRLDAGRQSLESTTRTPPEEIAAESDERDLCEVLLSSRHLEAAERAELESEDPATVRPVLDRRLQAYRDGINSWQAVREKVGTELEALEALDDGIEALPAPTLKDFDGGTGHAELRAARQQLQFAEAMVVYRQQRLDLLDQAHEAVRTLRDTVQDAGASVALAGSRLIELRAALQVAETMIESGAIEPFEFPEDLSVERLWAELKSMTEIEINRNRALTDLAQRLVDTAPREAAVAALERQQQQASDARAELKEESAYEAVVAGIQAMDDEALLARLKPGGTFETEHAAATLLVEERRGVLDQLIQNLKDVRGQLNALTSPFAQFEVNATPDRVQEIRAELEAMAAIEVEGEVRLPMDASVDGDREKRIRREIAEATVAEPPTGALSPSQEELDLLLLDQRAARDRLRYFEDFSRIADQYRSKLEKFDEAATTMGEALSTVEQIERRRYAAARALADRLGSGDVSGVMLPYNIGEWLSKEAVEAATATRRNQRAILDQSRSYFTQYLGRIGIYLAWVEWAQIGGKIAQDKVDLIAQPVGHIEAARKAIRDRPDFEQENLEYEAGERMALTSLWDRLLATIADATLRSRFEGPLEANYLEMGNLERIKREYGQAATAFEELIRVTMDSTQSLEEAIATLRIAEKTRLEDYQIARYHAAIAGRPGAQVPIAAAFREAYGTDLPQPIDDRGWDQFIWANRLLTAEARLWGDRRWIATMEHRLSRLGIESEVARYNGHVAEIGAKIGNIDSSIETLDGRIDDLKHDYAGALRQYGLQTLTRIAVIPIVAYLLVRLLRLFTRRIGARGVSDEDEDEFGRQRRFKTITNVVQASITVLVWVIAVIYILANLGLNITPIVASASVVGLAIAFGAQALVRDFFAGFFILLEDQYTVGDVIDVGSAAGTVEHITLRVTILRDLEGVVHYVPNGLVQRVSNRTKGWSRVVMEVQVGYREDVDRAIEVLRRVLEEMYATPPYSYRIIETPEVAGVQSMTDSTVGIRLMVKTKPGRQWEIGRELRRRIKGRFDEEGIREPFQQRIVHQIREEEPSLPGDS